MNRVGCWCIGFGLWCCTTPAKRKPLWQTACAKVGRNAILALNAAANKDELARRHAKPSTRRRVV